mgnify:CR=1 FL=1
MMLLLEIHTVLWFLQGAKETEPVRRLIEAASNTVSVVSLWEAAIKVSVGKLRLPYAIERLPELCARNSFELLTPEATDVVGVAKLPWHHRDPFDRLLAVQCLTRGLTLVSRDAQFDQYGVKRRWSSTARGRTFAYSPPPGFGVQLLRLRNPAWF